MQATQTRKTKLVECPKCDGLGNIRTFSHVLNGVCFCCKGHGVVMASRRKQPLLNWEENEKKIMFILNLDDARYCRLNAAQRSEIDRYVFAMTMNRVCMWLYHFYRERFRPLFLQMQYQA